jgi:hypothetical protein
MDMGSQDLPTRSSSVSPRAVLHSEERSTTCRKNYPNQPYVSKSSIPMYGRLSHSWENGVMMRGRSTSAAAASLNSPSRSAQDLRAPLTPRFVTRERQASVKRRLTTSWSWPSPLWGFHPRPAPSLGPEINRELAGTARQKLRNTRSWMANSSGTVTNHRPRRGNTQPSVIEVTAWCIRCHIKSAVGPHLGVFHGNGANASC